MEAALDSPLEALAINYLAYGFLTAVNNIWAWIAVITAAVSFWRIRALPSSTPELSIRSQDAAPETSTAPPWVAESAAAEPDNVSTTSESTPAKTSCRVLEREGSTKMKFSLYYKEDQEEDFRENDDGGDNEDGGGGAAVLRNKVLDAWRGDWEGMVAMRMGDMGWYRWQDRM
ncbi:hypothetical protein C2S51_001994, partial [Perilla frutescens var. frutescens]